MLLLEDLEAADPAPDYDACVVWIVAGATPEAGITNSYAASEQIFANARPASAPTNSRSFLATMLTGRTLAEAMRLVDQGLASDASFPNQSVILAKTTDPDRNIRHPYFDNAIFNNQILGRAAVIRTGRRKPTTGAEAMVGARGTARTALEPVGMVMVAGELWRARAEVDCVEPGASVEVLGVEGMELRVRRV